MHQFLKRMVILTVAAFFVFAMTWHDQDGSRAHVQGPESASDEAASAAPAPGTSPTILHGTARESVGSITAVGRMTADGNLGAGNSGLAAQHPRIERTAGVLASAAHAGSAASRPAASGAPATPGVTATSADRPSTLDGRAKPQPSALRASTSTNDYVSEDDEGEEGFPSWAWISIGVSLLILLLAAIGFRNSRKEYAWVKAPGAANASPPAPVYQQMPSAPASIGPGFGEAAGFGAPPDADPKPGFDEPVGFAGVSPGSAGSEGFGVQAHAGALSAFAPPQGPSDAGPYQASAPSGDAFAEPSDDPSGAASYSPMPTDHTAPQEGYFPPATPYGYPAAGDTTYDPHAAAPHVPAAGDQGLAAYGGQFAVQAPQPSYPYQDPPFPYPDQPPAEPQQAWFAANAPMAPVNAPDAQATPEPTQYAPAHDQAQLPEYWTPSIEVPGYSAAGPNASVGDALASLDASGYPAANYGAPTHGLPGYETPDRGTPDFEVPGYETPGFGARDHGTPGYPADDYGAAIFVEPAGGATPGASAHDPGSNVPATTPAPTVVDLPQVSASGEQATSPAPSTVAPTAVELPHSGPAPSHPAPVHDALHAVDSPSASPAESSGTVLDRSTPVPPPSWSDESSPSAAGRQTTDPYEDFPQAFPPTYSQPPSFQPRKR